MSSLRVAADLLPALTRSPRGGERGLALRRGLSGGLSVTEPTDVPALVAGGSTIR